MEGIFHLKSGKRFYGIKGKRLIDISLPIIPKAKWASYPRFLFGREDFPTRISTISTIKENGVFSQRIETTTQSFTHIDAPKHFDENGLANDEVPLEQIIGDAVVIDMMHKKPGEAVTASDLQASNTDVKEGDIAIIRTGWTDKAWGTKEFWRDMIWLSEDGCDWLIGKGIKALAQDFYTDIKPIRACEQCGSLLTSQPEKHPNHVKFLKENSIILIEWLTNLGKIKKPRVQLICLPMKIKGSDGAQARVIAIEDL